MQKRNLRTVWCTFTFVSLGILVAIQIILTRLLAVNIGGFGRITFFSAPKSAWITWMYSSARMRSRSRGSQL